MDLEEPCDALPARASSKFSPLCGLLAPPSTAWRAVFARCAIGGTGSAQASNGLSRRETSPAPVERTKRTAWCPAVRSWVTRSPVPRSPGAAPDLSRENGSARHLERAFDPFTEGGSPVDDSGKPRMSAPPTTRTVGRAGAGGRRRGRFSEGDRRRVGPAN